MSYGYTDGNLTSVTDIGGHEWHFAYDGDHRLTKMTDPRGGDTVNVYDDQGRVTQQTDPAGHTTTGSDPVDNSDPTGLCFGLGHCPVVDDAKDAIASINTVSVGFCLVDGAGVCVSANVDLSSPLRPTFSVSPEIGVDDGPDISVSSGHPSPGTVGNGGVCIGVCVGTTTSGGLTLGGIGAGGYAGGTYTFDPFGGDYPPPFPTPTSTDSWVRSSCPLSKI